MVQTSPSSRRAWIEIEIASALPSNCRVALLAEGVDRNGDVLRVCVLHHVALLAEGVDRNSMPTARKAYTPESPSSRRAWIEI